MKLFVVFTNRRMHWCVCVCVSLERYSSEEPVLNNLFGFRNRNSEKAPVYKLVVMLVSEAQCVTFTGIYWFYCAVQKHSTRLTDMLRLSVRLNFTTHVKSNQTFAAELITLKVTLMV